MQGHICKKLLNEDGRDALYARRDLHFKYFAMFASCCANVVA
jgi:hypothetical protein